jgi:hypothetical protein
MGDSSALRGVLALGFDGQRAAAENRQASLSVGLLIEFALLGGGRDGIKDARVRDPGFGVIGDELIAVGGDPDSGIARSSGHKSLPRRLPH